MNLKELIFGGGVAGLGADQGAYDGSIQAWLPVKDIIQGVVVTRDKRFIKIMELLPVNFYTMSEMERGSAIADFAAYLKIAPSNLQFNVLTQKFDLKSYLEMLQKRLDSETSEPCREMILESMDYVPRLVEREAITHRFFLSFSYDPGMKATDNTPASIAALLNEKAEIARRYLDRCGVAVLEPEYVDNFVLELLYQLVNKRTAQHIRMPEGAFDMLGMVHGVYDENVLKELEKQAAEPQAKGKKKRFGKKKKKPVLGLSSLAGGATTISDLLSPSSIDSHSPDHLLLDGVYHGYLYIAGYGYATVAGKGWLTPLIEAGEGVSVSFQLRKQPREKTLSSISQTTMVNRSRMRDVGDTRQDFEELGDAIQAGMYLKEGMNREGEDFYYMHTLIEVVADDPESLEQRMTAVETLCVASDMLAKRCEFKHEQAFLSFLPLLILDPDVERKSRRNALTNGVAAAFPFASYELSDPGGIFLGLNLYNRSPVFMDLFDDYRYTNGNFAAFGSSGAGKSTMLQSVGKRLREQGRKVVCIVPEKGHEYRPLCEALGGQFIKLGPSSQDCIGLMEIRRFRGAYGGSSSVRRDSLMAEKVSWLSVWYSLQKKNLSEEDRAYIDASLIECYSRYGITFENESLFEPDGTTPKQMPVIEDWYNILMEKEETKHLAVVLTRYVTGSAATMGGHTNIDMDNSYIVIDLTDLPDDLMLASLYAATGFATDIIVQNGDVGTGLLSDELWKLLGANSNPLAADYTMRMVKLIRSQGGIAGVTSQGMADMMALEGGKYGKGILDSCRIKFIMQMEEQEARLAQEKLNLTDEEVRMITRFRRGEGLLCIGHNHVPIGVHVSPKEYEAITTSPTDLRARLEQNG